MKRTIVLDFDGVLHSYTSGWMGATNIPDIPVPGMKDLCNELIFAGWEVVVTSARAVHDGGAEAIVKWLISNGFPVMHVTHEKVPAEVYVDDRGFRFMGDVEALRVFIDTDMTPWFKQTAPVGDEPGLPRDWDHDTLEAFVENNYWHNPEDAIGDIRLWISQHKNDQLRMQ